MPTSGIDYDKHGRPARVKSKKDSDTRSIVSSSTSRRHRDSSTSSSRTALPLDLPLQRSESTSSNISVEQLPSLPESDAGSPSSASSPRLRVNPKASASVTTMSSTLPRTPAFLQPYLESENNPPETLIDSQATPKAEKTREQCEVKGGSKAEHSEAIASKAPSSNVEQELQTPTPKSSSECIQAVAIRTSSQKGPPSPLNRDAQYRNLHQPEPKHPVSSGLALGTSPPNLPDHPSGYPPGPQSFPSFQTAYTHQSPSADPSTAQQALAGHGMLYYPYGHPPPPVPDPPFAVQYAPALDERLKEGDPMAVFHRVHYAMPDLHALLDSYQNMYNAMESREIQIRDLEAQRAAANQQYEMHFARMEKEAQALLKRHADECSRLKHQISNNDKKCKALHEKLVNEERTSDALQAANEDLRLDKKQTVKKHEEEKTLITQRFSHDKDRIIAEHRAKQRTLHDELQAQIRKAEATLAQREAYLSRAHEEEKQKLDTVWMKQRREIEDRYAKAKADLENKLEAKQKVVDEERRMYLQAREGWDREREAMGRRWDEERGILHKASEEQQKALVTRHEREKDDIVRQVSQKQHRAEKEEDISRLQREIESVQTAWEADRFKFQRTTAEFRSTARTLNEQNIKLQRLTESFGDSMDIKGK